MRYNKRDSQRSDCFATKRNSPYLFQRMVIIVSSYTISGVNLIIAGFISNWTRNEIDIIWILLGFTMIMLGVVSIFDNRREMRGNLAVSGVIILSFILGVMLAVLENWLWIIVYMCEFAAIFASMILTKRH